MCVTSYVRSVFQGSRKILHTVEDAIIRCEGWLGDMLVAEFDSVRNVFRFGGFCYHSLAPVMPEGEFNSPIILASEIPCIPCSYFLVKDETES